MFLIQRLLEWKRFNAKFLISTQKPVQHVLLSVVVVVCSVSLEKVWLVSTRDTVDDEVIEVDELHKGNISAAERKQDE